MAHATSLRSLVIGLAAMVSLNALAMLAAAQQAPPMQNFPYSVMPIRGGIYLIVGGVGGNTGLIVGGNDVIVIDAKTTPDSAKEMLAEVAKVTPKPVTHVILTHSDADHVDGLPAFPKGVTIIAQENCKTDMQKALNTARGAGLENWLPTHTVKDKESMKIDGVRFILLNFGPAHTTSDLVIYLPDQKIVFVGDLVELKFSYPFIHAEKNGSSEGWIRTMETVAALDADTFVPGHGDQVESKANIEKRIAAAVERRAKIKEMVSAGKSLEQIKSALGETDAQFMLGTFKFASFTEVVYNELTKKD